eukprot:753499-Hanusia_phi.AAC.1
MAMCWRSSQQTRQTSSSIFSAASALHRLHKRCHGATRTGTNVGRGPGGKTSRESLGELEDERE